MNDEDSIFFAGLYLINKGQGVRDDLISAISELYGEPTKNGDFTVWQGENHVEITLYDEEQKYSYPFFSLAYIWLDAEPMLDATATVIDG